MSGRLSKSLDRLMDEASNLLDAGLEVLGEALVPDEHTETVSTTIRIRLNHEHLGSLWAGKTLQFKVDGTTILIEKAAQPGGN